MRYTVYKITNLINGKIYVGAHATEFPNDGYLGSGKGISSAVKKYGRGSFIKEVLFDYATPEEMWAKEQEIVNDDFRRRQDTYNITRGGKSALAAYSSEDKSNWGRMGQQAFRARLQEDPNLREKLRETGGRNLKRAHEKRNLQEPTFKGCSHSVESRRKMSEAAKSRPLERNNQLGKMWVFHPDFGARSQRNDEPLEEGWVRGRGPRCKTQKPQSRKKSDPEKQRRAKLTWAAVRDIRTSYAEDPQPHYKLAARFGVSRANITLILNNKAWVEEGGLTKGFLSERTRV